MGDQMRKAWDKNAVVFCMIAAVLMGIMFGHTISSASNQTHLLELTAQQVKERASLNRRHAAEKTYLRKQLAERNATIARQSDQLATNGGKAADGAKAVIQLIDKQTPKASQK